MIAFNVPNDAMPKVDLTLDRDELGRPTVYANGCAVFRFMSDGTVYRNSNGKFRDLGFQVTAEFEVETY
jgi:hypothetical protein